MTAQSNVLHLQAASSLLYSVSPRLSGSARSKMLLEADQANLSLPEGFVSSSTCSSCRTMRIAGDTASIRLESRKSRKRRRTESGAEGVVRTSCLVCGHEETIDGATVSQKRLVKKAANEPQAATASTPAPPIKPAQAPKKDAEPAQPKRKRKKGLDAMLAASKAARDKATGSTSLDGSLSSFLSEIGAT